MPTKEKTTYHYVYYPFFDSSCHEFGVDSEESFCEAQKIDNIAGLVEKEVCNKTTLAIFVSDHGMIDIPRENKLSASLFPNTIGLIDSAMSGEPRVSYCFVSESNKDKFESAFKYEMSQYAHLLELQKVFKNGWFGQDNGLGSTKYRKVIGDYAILMKDHYTLVDDLPGEPESCFIGMHGGLMEDEVLIPVMLIGG